MKYFAIQWIYFISFLWFKPEAEFKAYFLMNRPLGNPLNSMRIWFWS